VISAERIGELRSEVGEDDFGEIVALFIAESDLLVSRLGAVSDPAEAVALLHALKGSALNLGFETLADLCRDSCGRQAGTPAWAQDLGRLRDVYEQSKLRLSTLS
jgi:HPt (histidine-containing phosphotransfer) domain-containing protein